MLDAAFAYRVSATLTLARAGAKDLLICAAPLRAPWLPLKAAIARRREHTDQGRLGGAS